MDQVCIEGLRVAVLIGVYPWERAAPQQLTVDLALTFDCRPAARTDDLAAAVDYGAVAAAVVECCAQSRFQLVEALAEACAARLLEAFPAQAVRIAVRKRVNVPHAGAFDAVVRLERQRASV
jgi:7,8-dihydroneopterin aldolase/epimerase/oxygenase